LATTAKTRANLALGRGGSSRVIRPPTLRTPTRRPKRQPRAPPASRAEAPTCQLDEQVAEVAARLPPDWDICVVANEERVVLGLLGRQALRAGGDVRVEEAMTPAPSTIRPSARLDAIANRMRDENLTRLLVTRSDGVLVGVLRREDVESTLLLEGN
jgi:CBS domain-containing protein